MRGKFQLKLLLGIRSCRSMPEAQRGPKAAALVNTLNADHV